jgi:uncharacterized protein YndB with AHSA1/START domain
LSNLQITCEPGIPQIIITRAFNAPREFILRAHIEPELLKQWYGPRNYSMVIERLEPRDGGSWRFTHMDPDGNEFGFHGLFHGTPSVEDGIVQTFEFEGTPGHVSLETLTLEERDGQTLLHANSVFQSVEDRDAVIGAGMEGGIIASYDRLDELAGARIRSPTV